MENGSGSSANGDEESAQADMDGQTEESDHMYTTESSDFNGQFSMRKFMRVLGILTEEQKSQIRNCGFGSLLDLKCSMLPHPIVVWLAKHFDEKSASIQIEGTQPIKLDALLVHKILGIPYKGRTLSRKCSKDAKAIIESDTGCGKLAPSIVDLIRMINPRLVGDQFVRVFMLIALSVFLCPTSCSRVSPNYYDAIHNVKKIINYNWSDAVLTCLLSGLRKFKLYACRGNTTGKATLGGCLFVICTAYFDYLLTECCTVPQTIPRISAWTDGFVSEYMMLHSKLDKFEIKAHECTLFAITDLKSKPSGGVCFGDSKTLPANTSNYSFHSPQDGEFEKTTKVMQKLKSPANESKTFADCNLNIDTEHVEKVFSEDYSRSRLSSLCGDVLHPDVDKFIHASVGNDCNTEVVSKLKNMC